MWKAMLAMTQVTQGVHTSPAFRLSVHPAELGIGQACRTQTIKNYSAKPNSDKYGTVA